MKLSQQWLQDFLTIDLDAETLSNTLTSAGLEVAAVEPVAHEFSQVVIGQIKTIEPHPDADKLRLCTVDIGQAEPLSIVCGADNIYSSMKIPVALIGAILPGNIKIKKSKLRGQTSYGMMCSEKELGLSEDAEGLMDLPQDAPLGQCIRQYLSLDDNSIEIDLTPNRADCLSIYGIAREVAALTDNTLNVLSIEKQAVKNNQIKPVTVDDATACPRYFSRVITGVNAKAVTPLWMKERLRRSGVQLTSVIVDITNYVLLTFGQPMHAFDADQLGQEVRVRYAKAGEKITLLNKTEITLDAKTLVIADPTKILAVAGIMGGLETAVNHNTTNIFLESAYFSPQSMRGKAREYALNTESSHRYERGVDPALAEDCIEYATQLILEIAGGKAGKVTGVTQAMPDMPTIELSLVQLNRLLGVAFDAPLVENILRRLNMKLEANGQDCWCVIPPSYRFDITIEADLIEEVARVYGFQKLPLKLPKMPLHSPEIKGMRLTLSRLKTLMVDRGYHEAINYSFISPKFNTFFSKHPSITVQNPISQDMAVMRQSLLPGLLLNYKANLNRQQPRIRLFEQGRCFFPAEQQHQYQEYEYFSAIAGGSLLPIGSRSAAVVDFYAVKSDLEALLGCYEASFSFKVCDEVPWLHPGQSAYIYQQNQPIGVIGVLHPNAMKLLQIKSHPPVVFELYCDKIMNKSSTHYQKISKFPSVSRDIALIVDQQTSAQSVIDAAKKAKVTFLQEIDVFDIYQDDTLPQNKKSVAIRLTFQNDVKTLNEQEISDAMNKILGATSQSVAAILRE